MNYLERQQAAVAVLFCFYSSFDCPIPFTFPFTLIRPLTCCPSFGDFPIWRALALFILCFSSPFSVCFPPFVFDDLRSFTLSFRCKKIGECRWYSILWERKKELFLMLPIVVCLLNSIFIHGEEIYRYLYIQQNDGETDDAWCLAVVMIVVCWFWCEKGWSQHRFRGSNFDEFFPFIFIKLLAFELLSILGSFWFCFVSFSWVSFDFQWFDLPLPSYTHTLTRPHSLTHAPYTPPVAHLFHFLFAVCMFACVYFLTCFCLIILFLDFPFVFGFVSLTDLLGFHLISLFLDYLYLPTCLPDHPLSTVHPSTHSWSWIASNWSINQSIKPIQSITQSTCSVLFALKNSFKLSFTIAWSWLSDLISTFLSSCLRLAHFRHHHHRPPFPWFPFTFPPFFLFPSPPYSLQTSFLVNISTAQPLPLALRPLDVVWWNWSNVTLVPGSV